MERLVRLTKRISSREIEVDAGGWSASYYPADDCFNALVKLAHYEDLKEAGRLVELPCELGDYIYDISEFVDGNKHPEMLVFKARYIELSMDADGEINFCIGGYEYKKEDFGKTVFANIEEAEATLKGGE